MNANSETTRAYDKIASHYSKAHFKPFWVKEFIFFKARAPGKKIVDVGCGAGRDATMFVKDGFDYIGIDGSRGMLKAARARAKKGKFALMDFYRLKFPAETFDGFWAAASLLHAPKSKITGVLKGMRKILKPQGIGFISVKEKKENQRSFFGIPPESRPLSLLVVLH